MKNILLEIKNNIAYITLNREEVHNAFDEKTILELTKAFNDIDENNDVRALVLKGNGPNFCAGGDLNWMKRSAKFSEKENVEDAAKLALMLYTFYHMSKPTIALVQGAVYGGGVGLAAAADIVIALENTKFCLSEVKLGLVPSVISPYVVRAMGSRQMKRYAQTAEIFTAKKAYEMGFIHEPKKTEKEAEQTLGCILLSILSNAPESVNIAKKVVGAIAEYSIDEDVMACTAEWIAECRSSDEGKEGVNAFLEKRLPNWIKE